MFEYKIAGSGAPWSAALVRCVSNRTRSPR